MTLRQMGTDGIVHLLGHIQGQVASPREILPGSENRWDEKDREEALFGLIGGHFFVFLNHEIRGAGKDEVVFTFELLEIHGLGGLEQERDGGGGLDGGDHLAVRWGEFLIGIDADVGDTEGHGGEGSATPSCAEVQDALGLKMRIDPLGHDGTELINRSVIQLESIVLGFEETLGGIVRQSLLFVTNDEFGQVLFLCGILHGFVEGEMGSGLRLQAVMKKEVIQGGKTHTPSVTNRKGVGRRSRGGRLQILVGLKRIGLGKITEFLGKFHGHRVGRSDEGGERSGSDAPPKVRRGGRRGRKGLGGGRKGHVKLTRSSV